MDDRETLGVDERMAVEDRVEVLVRVEDDRDDVERDTLEVDLLVAERVREELEEDERVDDRVVALLEGVEDALRVGERDGVEETVADEDTTDDDD